MYHKAVDTYKCVAGRMLNAIRVSNRKSKSGYIAQITAKNINS